MIFLLPQVKKSNNFNSKLNDFVRKVSISTQPTLNNFHWKFLTRMKILMLLHHHESINWLILMWKISFYLPQTTSTFTLDINSLKIPLRERKILEWKALPWELKNCEMSIYKRPRVGMIFSRILAANLHTREDFIHAEIENAHDDLQKNLISFHISITFFALQQECKANYSSAFPCQIWD